ncbi:YggT family protein [Bifidobacterium criceti]|uniref:Hemolysin n=1 Tax=Bifidobacterium criceti TaxID=1960969 RepID=A0A2A2ED51_9BIFI|nr:YggT family protein [Bifidobacterium criceti]PAU66951.1 hemolysin [Bifidobacterium criceti]
MLALLLAMFFRLVDWLIDAYLIVLFARMILDWVFVLARGWHPHGFVATLVSIVYALTDPPLRWLRRYIKPIPLGPVSFDTSFLVLYFALIVLQVLI